MSFRSMIAFGESNSCSTDAICFFRWSIPNDDVCKLALQMVNAPSRRGILQGSALSPLRRCRCSVPSNFAPKHRGRRRW